MQNEIKKNSLGLILALVMLLSGAAGFGGGLIASAFGGQAALATTSTDTINLETIAESSSNNVQGVTLKTSSGKTGSNETLSVAGIAQIAAPSVVEITTEVRVSGQHMQQYVSEGAGSGVILTSDGMIITNNHVIEDAETITVRLPDEQTYTATLVGTDVKTDLAVIKIEASGLTAATIGDSSELAVGDLAVAIGNPLGELGGTVTDGIISALDREITIDGETMNLLQTNAAINPGNSGGGLFDSFGNLIGIVCAKSSGTDVEGLGFAIPINDAVPVLEELINNGYVQGRIDLGMTLVDIDTEESAMMYRVSKLGVYVLKVISGSNAETAGFASGDCILSVDGTEVSNSSELNAVLDQHNVGDTVQVLIYRSRQNIDLTWTLSESRPTT